MMAFRPVSTSNSMGQNLNELNNMVRQLNKEQTAKTFKQAGGSNAVIVGKLPYDGGYGVLIYDSTDSRVILGVAPDGSVGLFVSKTGEDVISAFS